MCIDIKKLTSKMCEKEISQKQLARGAGVSEVTISSIINKGTAKVQTLGKIASFLEVDAGLLLKQN